MDHIILRYKTNFEQKDFQLLQIVEVKEFGAEPDRAQEDVLSFITQMIERKQQNESQRKQRIPLRKSGNGSLLLKSKLNGRKVTVRFLGYHLLQFEKTGPLDSAWIKWDGKTVSPGELVGLLAIERRPDKPDKMMIEFLRDRHSKNETLQLFEL